MSEPKEPLWITYEQAIAIHSRQLRRFGGAPGLRDEPWHGNTFEAPSGHKTESPARVAMVARRTLASAPLASAGI